MRFACLGSGSRGNAWLVEAGSTRVLVDCGFSRRATERRLARLGLEAGQLSALLVTHEHADHAGGVARLAQAHDLPVYLTAGTREAAGLADLPHLHSIHAWDAPFAIDGLQVQPYTVPHDARETVQFVLGDGRHRLGLLTDAGHVTPHILQVLDGCDALVLETNHDGELLAAGPYHPALKRRVAGAWGHLSNSQAAAGLKALGGGRLQHLVAAHLSEQNNTRERVVAALAGALGCAPAWIGVAEQEAGLDWRALA